MASKKHLTGLERRIREVVRQHHPRGWRLIERHPRYQSDGQALPPNRIYAPPLRTVYALYVYLHEVGHVRHKHIHPGRATANDPPEWQVEYEAEIYAIKSMRAAGFSVEKYVLDAARENVAMHLDNTFHHPNEDEEAYPEAVKFAFPKTFREWL